MPEIYYCSSFFFKKVQTLTCACIFDECVIRLLWFTKWAMIYIPLSTIQKKVSGSRVSIRHQSCVGVYTYAYMISPYPFICMAYMVFDLPRTNYLTLFDNLENWSSFSGQMKSSPRTCSSSSLIIFVVIIVVIMNGIERGNEKMKKSKERFFIVGYTL